MRLRRWILGIALTIMLLLPALLLGVLMLGLSEDGTGMMARALSRVEPRLQLQHAGGNILSPRFASIRWIDEELSVTLAQVQWTLSPGCLLRDQICIETLEIGLLDIDIGTPSGDSTPLSLVPVLFPMDIETADARLGQLRVLSAGEVLFELSDIRLSAQTHGSRIDISSMQASSEDLRASVQGQVDLRDQLPLALRGRLVWQGRETAELTLSGDLSRLGVSAEVSGSYAFAAQGEIEALATPLAGSLSARSSAPIAVIASDPELLSIVQAELRLGGTLEQLDISLDALTRSSALGENQLEATGNFGKGRLTIETLALEGEAGRLDATAQLDTALPREWRIAARLQEFCPNAWSADFSCALDGRLDARGNIDAAHPSLHIETDLNGKVNDFPAALRGSLSMLEQGHWQLDDVIVASGSNRATLQGVYGAESSIEATLQLGNLGDTLRSASGNGSGTLRIGGSATAPTVRGSLALDGPGYGDNVARSLGVDVDWRGPDDSGNRLKLDVRGLRTAGRILEHTALTLSGPARAHQLRLRTSTREASLALGCDATLDATMNWSARCGELLVRASADGAGWSLQQPIVIAWNASRAELGVQPFCLGGEQSSLCSRSAITLAQDRIAGIDLLGSGLPLFWFQGWLPENVTAEGVFELQVSAAKDPNQPLLLAAELNAGQWLLRTLAAGEELPLALNQIQARLVTGRDASTLSWRFGINGKGNSDGEIVLQQPGRGNTLSGSARLRDIEIAPLALMVAGVADASGTLEGDFQIGGVLRNPEISGALRVRDGMLSHEKLARPIDTFALDIAFAGADAQVGGRFSTAGGNGTIDGSVSWGEQSWAAQLRLRATELMLEPLRDSTVTVTPDLLIELGPQRALVSGELFVPAADIRLDRLPETAISISSDTVLVGVEEPGSPFAYEVAVKLRLGNNVRLRGLGVDAHLDGSMEIGLHSDREASGRGDIRISSGRFAAYGQRLEITEGIIRFRGALERPELRITAVRRVENDETLVGVRVRGYAREPTVRVFSQPAMEENRALYYLLTGRAPDAESNMDLAVMTAMLQLGLAGTNKITGNVMQKFGVQDFQVDARQVEGGTEVHLSGYLSPDLYLRYGVSTFERVNTFRLRYRLRPRIFVEAISGIESAVDLLYSFER